ncbi:MULTISPECIES: hypothetical protein [unclassified Streptomyces]|uniref:hypothetical protein n=1 Tax=unclassified Streptomyces TaxID=2593676 RepID=UPI001F3DA647|nr:MULTISPECIES: hypothetical protein [unclassified Streptomyces]
MDSSDLYRAITYFAHRTPSWVQSALEIWTTYGLLRFGVLFVAVRWRSRGRGGARPVESAVLAPVATAGAYGASECVKYTVDEERPCRSVAGAAASPVPCPGPATGRSPAITRPSRVPPPWRRPWPRAGAWRRPCRSRC